MHGPLKDREIKLVARMDDKFLEINFADGPNRVQVRCGGLGEGPQVNGDEGTG